LDEHSKNGSFEWVWQKNGFAPLGIKAMLQRGFT